MKRTALFIACASFFSLCGIAQSVDIFLNTNDCINCTSALSQLVVLDSSVHVQILCDESNKDFIPVVLDRFGVVRSEKLGVGFISHRRSLREAPQGSMVAFRSGAEVVYRFPLKEIGAYMSRMNLHAKTYRTKHVLPIGQKLTVSDRARCVPYRSGLMASDDLTGVCYVLEPTNNGTVQQTTIRLDEDRKRKFFVDIGLDTLRYDSFAVSLRNQGLFYPTVASANVSGDSVHLLWDIRYVEKNPTYGDMIQYYPAITSWSNGDFGTTRFCDWRMLQPDSGYVMHLNQGFYLSDKELCMPIHNTQPTTDPDLIASFHLSGNTIAMDRVLDVRCPSIIRPLLTPRTMLLSAFFDDLFALRNYPLVVALATRREFDFGKLLLPKKSELFIDEVPQFRMHGATMMSERDMLLLYQVKDRYTVAWIDVDKMELVRATDVDLSSLKEGSGVLTRSGSIVGLTKGNDALVILE